MFTKDRKPSLQTFVKLLGLILTAGGIWMACSALVMAISPPSYAELLARIDMPPALRHTLEGMQPPGSVLLRQVMATFMLQGILPILIGTLLMRVGGGLRPAPGSRVAVGRSALRRFFMPRMSFALARIEDEIESGYRPFTLGG